MDALLDLVAAHDWAHGVLDEAGPDYASAVDWCLVSRPIISPGEGWRKEFLQSVVQPLENCHKYLDPSTNI